MIKYLLSLLVLIFISIMPLLHYGLIPTHDGEYHIVRFYEFYKVLSEGIIYPRWAPDFNNGYGIPLFNFVYPLPNYIASLFHLFGFSFIDSFKVSIIASSFLAGIFFYKWCRNFFGVLSSVVGAVFYIYTPYRFVDIYVRGSIGELWVLAFFPGFLFTITGFFKTQNKYYLALSSIFLALTIFSHNILGLMFFIFGLFYIGVLIFQQKNSKYLILNIVYILLLSLGLSAIFWLPALSEKQFVRGLEIYDIHNNFPQLYQLLVPSWGTGFSEGGLQNQMSFQIGAANLLAVFFSLLFVFKDRAMRRVILFFITLFFLVSYLMLSHSSFIWNNITFLQFFQFPWRLLSLTMLITSFLAAYVTYRINKNIFSYFLVGLIFFLSISYTQPAYYLEREDEYYLTRSNFIHGTNSPGNVFNTKWMKSGLAPAEDFFKADESLTVSNINKKSSYITVGIAYFPGWKVFTGEKELKTSYNKDGLITFPLPTGDYRVTVIFDNTKIRTIAEVVSVLSVGILLFVIMRMRKSFKI